MERLRTVLRKLFCLPPVLTVIIAVPSFVFVVLVLCSSGSTWLAYVSYVLPAYGMIISVTAIVRFIRGVKERELPAVQKLRANPIGDKLISDEDFRSELSVYGGLAGNLFYSALNLLMGFIYNSAWHYTLIAYYVLLSLMRGWLIRSLRRRPAERDIPAEYRVYRVIGYMLLFMNQVLAGMVFYMAHQGKGSQYPGLLIYAAAAYTLYITILAIINVFKYRRRHSPVLSAAKNISLTASLVSQLSLETAMITAFGGGDLTFRRIMTSALGGVVCVIVLGVAIFMIVKANRFLKEDVQNGGKAGKL